MNASRLMVGCLAVLGGFYVGSWIFLKLYSVDFIAAQHQTRMEQRRRAPPTYEPDTWLNFAGNDAAATKPYQVQGWSHPEPPGTWTDGPDAELALRLTPAPSGPLQLTTHIQSAITSPQQPVQGFTLLANDQVIGQRSVPASGLPLHHEAVIPATVLREDGILRLTLRIHYPLSPRALGQNSDSRQLGIMISQMQISPMAASSLLHSSTPPR